MCNTDVKRNTVQTGIRIYIKDHDETSNARVFCDFGAVKKGDGIKFKWLLNTSKFRQLCIGRGLSIVYEIEYDSTSTISSEEEENTLVNATASQWTFDYVF